MKYPVTLHGRMENQKNAMKRVISVLLLLSFTGSLFHLDEVTKIPALINHYKAYCPSGQDKSFRTF